MRKETLALGMVALAVLATTGCTFWYSTGGGPLTREELGDWAGMRALAKPAAEQLEKLADRTSWPILTFVGGYSIVGDAPSLYLRMPAGPYNIPATPAPHHEIRVDFPTWRHLVPSSRYGVYLYVPRLALTSREPYREYCAAERDWGGGLILFDFLFRGSSASVYDRATGERAAAESSLVILGWGLGYNRVRQVMPVDAASRPGLHVFGELPPSRADVRYEVRDGTSLLFGLVGWGRVNHRRYLQLLWIPIPVGRVKMPG